VRNRYDEAEAAATIDRYGARWGEDLALRVYTSRLLGAEPALVMHGGGNTSVKGTHVNVLGEPVPALYVKGSGWDLATIEPQGLPGVQLDHLRRLVDVPVLSDEDMINEQRTHLFDASAPNPSIEALLHAFLPARFVDHSHADAVLILTNRPDGARHVTAALGDDVLLVPYVKPGFDLAVVCARLFRERPDCRAMVLMQHGLFTWGETAKQAYDDHIELVTRAEAYLARLPAAPAPAPRAPSVAAAVARAAEIGPLLRGVLAEVGKTWILEHRASDDLLATLADPRLDRWVAAGPLTPDHVIRTRPLACVARVPGRSESEDDDAVAASLKSAIESFREASHATFAAHVAGRPLRELDPNPRVLLVPGVGLFAAAESVGAARIAADIGERTLEVKRAAEPLGPFEGLPAADLFEVEYWSLEQAKLGKGKEAPLARKVALITGGAGAIGVGIAKALLDAGACVALADRDALALARAATALKPRPTLMTVVLDVTDAESTRAGFAAVAARWGGVDIVVPNAGIAHSAPLVDLDDDAFSRVMDVNARGVFLTTREAARALVRQGTGGHILIISSKNVFGPGEEFAAYSASKAAAHQVGRVAALELARHGVRVNMINPDAVFSQGGIQSGLWATVGPDRARARGLKPEDLPEFYRQRNLLHAEVTGEHVGNAVVFFASELTPTTGAALPVDGGVATAFPR
jgi:rhamnulose-1-phosphate aldolase/alcohol dehydrogenase